MKKNISRRNFVTGLTAGTLLTANLWAENNKKSSTNYLNKNVLANNPKNQQSLRGNYFELTIGQSPINLTGRDRLAVTVNGSLPAPVLHWQEGERVTIKVKNNLSSDTSIHWHGMILPTEMDGVPGLSFDGIKPKDSFEYSFDVKQNGTYWYHSHSGYQEQMGMYGAIVIHPKDNDPVSYDRDYIVMLSDWSDENPGDVYRHLKIMPHYYNTNERTVGDLYQDIKNKGIKETWRDRSMWNRMRMSDRDISDVTGYNYTFLMNGQTPAEGWFGLFKKGEKVRLRFINAAAMTFFDVRIPGLKMKVVSADGQNIDPVSVDEFRIGVAETYDVIVEPENDAAYTVFAQAMDRSGYARGTLAADPSMKTVIPEMDPSPILSHTDMGMSHERMGHDDMGHGDAANKKMDHSSMDHSSINHSMMSEKNKTIMGSGLAGFGGDKKIIHHPSEYGAHIDMLAEMPQFALDDPGIGLRDHKKKYGRKVLTYRDLCNFEKTPDPREPSREIQLHLNGNMHRYMWSFNGIKFSDAEPLELFYGERVRITLVNDTMMNHPIHLHGMWSDLETGDPDYIPRKHTVIVQPGTKISYLVTVDAKGRWAYHCHLLFHMMGMFREVLVK
ncbi:MAG: copper resistance system multicopper oxidase [Cellvibrionaceae bacterium]